MKVVNHSQSRTKSHRGEEGILCIQNRRKETETQTVERPPQKRQDAVRIEKKDIGGEEPQLEFATKSNVTSIFTTLLPHPCS